LSTNHSKATSFQKLPALRKKLSAFRLPLPTLLLLAMLSLLPIAMVFFYSLQDNVIMNKTPMGGVQNYIEILGDSVFQQALLNTLYFTGMSVLFHLLLGLAFALPTQHPPDRSPSQSALSHDLYPALGLHSDESSPSSGGCCSTPTASSITCCFGQGWSATRSNG
jgi:hypothetical protein